MSLQKNFLVCLVSLFLGSSFLIFGVSGCGSSTNNDQGTSFLAFGWFAFTDEDSSGDPDPIGAIRTNLSSDTAFQAGNLEVGSGTGIFDITPLIGLENRLETQFLRVERVDCSYTIQGASPGFSIPDDSTFIGNVLGAQPVGDLAVGQAGFGDGNGTADGDGNFPSDDSVRPQVVFARVLLVDPDLTRFLNLNQNSLPNPPFTMDARCQAVGITQAGDVLTTNPINLPVIFENSLINQVEGPTDFSGQDDETASVTFAPDSPETTSFLTSSGVSFNSSDSDEELDDELEEELSDFESTSDEDSSDEVDSALEDELAETSEIGDFDTTFSSFN